MNVAYLPMGSMQLGPNGELIPTSVPAATFAAAAPQSIVSSANGAGRMFKVLECFTGVY